MKTLTLSLALLFATAIAVHAQQNDYIVNTHGDTVKCKITKPFLGGPRYTIGDFSDKITTSDVAAYYQSKEHTMVRAVYTGNSKRPTFMVVIEDGPITLYEDVNTYYNAGTGVSTSTRNWFWSQKSSNQAEPLKTSALSIGSKSREERMHDFAELLREKHEIYEAFISQKSFSFNQIQKLVHWYNTGEKMD
ncbi:hypothetical protein C8P68_101601 [Mucilaginibacter yixingensis]|uniref:Uncharacterized protein n=1 Tax=Mucilaginibacter yixingensis TaxID=1295612 RepID=A0A2T5JG11_9SPHI|nr:hypothetical protein [Mucilaginibacter yixingensis]PTR01367.1 hypothetical protein C8P68_101601 [Mucilaginibacter yixingensis]